MPAPTESLRAPSASSSAVGALCRTAGAVGPAACAAAARVARRPHVQLGRVALAGGDRWRFTFAAAAATATVAAPGWAAERPGARLPPTTADALDAALQHCASAEGCRVEDAPLLASCLRHLSASPGAPHLMRRMRPRQLASVMRSLARLGAHPGEDALADLDAACYSHPGPFDAASTAGVLQALAALHAAGQPAPAAHAAPPPAAPSRAAASSAQRRNASRRAAPQHAFGAMHASPSPSSTRAARGQASGRATSAAAHTEQEQQQRQEAPAPPFRFPHAVRLRLAQGGVHKYTYEQLAAVLQAFRTLGVALDDELALAVGRHMAAQLSDMAPERRQAALGAVLGA